jgi:hypothetical protein
LGACDYEYDAMTTKREFIAEVTARIRRFCQGDLNSHEVSRLVTLSAAIAQQRLWGRLRAAAQAQETSIRHLAISMVTDLFVVIDGVSLLAKVLEDELEQDDVTLYRQFNAVVVRHVEQELFHRWRESDPMSARLWRNLQRVCRSYARVVAFPDHRPQWVALSDTQNLHEHLPAIDYMTLTQIVSEQAAATTGLGKLVVGVLSHIAELRVFQQAVQIEAIFAALRETKSTVMAVELDSQPAYSQQDPHFRSAVEKAIMKAMSELQKRLDRYVTRTKLTVDVAEYFCKALHDLVKDCVDGGPAQSYYEYIRSHWPDLSYARYRRDFRSQFEYLANCAQRRFYEAMRKLYYE